MKTFLFVWAAVVGLAGAQTRILPLVIDGELDEPLWLNLDASKLAPAEAGVPREMGGEVRAAVIGRYLYVGARLPEPEGRFTARSIGRNPQWEEEDLLRIVVDGQVLQVSPLGAYEAPNERFLAAAQMGLREWRVEAAIPLNQPGARFTVERVRAMRPGSPELRWRVEANLPVGQDGPPPVFHPQPLGNNDPGLDVGRRDPLPPLASGWDDPAWRDVPAWQLLRDEPAPRLPRLPAEVKLVHDGRTLAVLARSAGANAADSFQVYLATSGSAYAQFTITPAGTVEGVAGMSGGPRISRPRANWHSSVRGAARVEPEAWTARLDIPLEETAKALGEARIPSEWRILLVRAREWSVLPAIQSPTPLCPARYLRLGLASADPARLGSPPRLASAETGVLSAPLAGMLGAHLRDRVLRVLEEEKRAWDRVQTREDWERFRDPRLKALAASLGEFPPREPLRTRVTKEYRGDGYRRQDLIYQSRPGLWVTANLYLPAQPVTRMPGIVIVHSHHRPRTQAELQDMGILWARAGCAVLIMDQLGAGERIQNYPWNREAYHSRYVMGMQLSLAGESLIGWMVWDIRRGIDLLLERPDVDPQRVILLGAVAGGGDPAAVAAALDPRITAVAPFNFGEATPETPRFLPEKNRWPLELADPGWGSWESTRCLRRSIADQFLPWMICASVAPRPFVYSFEMGWNVEDLPAWRRYQKVFGFYNASESLAEAHGFGPFPGPGECTNIGPAQRQTLYPALQRWFGIPPPATEPEDRRPEPELAALTPANAPALGMRMVHELAYEIGRVRRERARAELRKLAPDARREWLQAQWAARLGDIEPNRNPGARVLWTRDEEEGIALDVEPGIVVPVRLRKPTAARAPVVIALGAANRAEIDALVTGGTAVCLPDVRGTGETAPDTRRGPMSAGISLAATELMLGNTMLGARLKDLRTVLAYLTRRPDLDTRRIAVWGDSVTPVNPSRLVLDELPWWQVGPQIQQQAEPLGGLLAILGALYEPDVHAVAVRRGLVGYLSILEDRFAYVPADVMVPGALEAGDIGDLAAALAPRPLLLEGLVDGRNRAASDSALRGHLAPVYDVYRDAVRPSGARPGVVEWLRTRLHAAPPAGDE
ncbi:MAG: acetylxylan esterase [Acidobacteria bacterium]|nr:acetylxylan esterase [Acidobacteriota bacterium]